MTNHLTPEEIVKSFKDEFKTKINESHIEKRKKGPAKNEFVPIVIEPPGSPITILAGLTYLSAVKYITSLFI